MDETATQTERNKSVIRRFVEEVQNQRRWDVYDELTDPDFFNLSGLPGKADREGSKQYLQSLIGAFPDCRFTVDDMIAEGDQVVTNKTISGTHTVEFAGIPPTGKDLTLQYIDVMRIRDGRIIEHWLVLDQLSFLQQLGIIPS